jgi:nucleotide-binding universal stress UspA family protein
MLPTITVGLDGSRESLSAADWAARESLLRGMSLRLIHAWGWQHSGLTHGAAAHDDTHRHWAERIPREAAADLRRRYPGLAITTDQVAVPPARALQAVAAGTELLVLGSRAMGATSGFLVGSVAYAVVARAGRPVVLVRAGADQVREHQADAEGRPSPTAPYRDVVLGLDLRHPGERVLEFAFDAAARRGAALRVVHSRNLPLAYGFDTPGAEVDLDAELAAQEANTLEATLRPWREKFPDVHVIGEATVGPAARHLIEAASRGSLLVIGRRVRTARIGPHLGSVTHAVLHHSIAPVAVIPQD